MFHQIQPHAHGPLGQPMTDAVQACVHCGFCLAACPTYRELGQEMDTPRGRIVLMKQVLEGTLPLESALPHVDRCLGCLACEPACPSGVAYRDLISPFRAISEQKRRRSLLDRVRRKLIAATLPYPGRFRLAVVAGRLGKMFAGLLPKSFRPMVDLVPDRLPPRQSWPAVNPAIGERRARVALLIGCAQQVIDPDINSATIDVITRNGVEVLVPAEQGCCGALSWHVGDLSAAQGFARRNLRAFPKDVDAIVTNAAGCGSGLHEYHLILAGTPDAEAAEHFRHRVVDVSAFLHGLGLTAPFPARTKPLRIAYHDACHLANAQGVRSQPRALLRSIPEVELVELPNPHLCCGSAGTYNLDQPEIAAHLGAEKAKSIAASGADVAATGNIGCITQLRAHLAGRIPILHSMQILRDAYRGEKLAGQ
jgi:glycolate oxidase iron-sulfur subunit